jgi:hypothetical protein
VDVFLLLFLPTRLDTSAHLTASSDVLLPGRLASSIRGGRSQE